MWIRCDKMMVDMVTVLMHILIVVSLLVNSAVFFGGLGKHKVQRMAYIKFIK